MFIYTVILKARWGGSGDSNLDTTVGNSRAKLLNISMVLIEAPLFYICTHASVLTVLKLILVTYIADQCYFSGFTLVTQVFNAGF